MDHRLEILHAHSQSHFGGTRALSFHLVSFGERELYIFREGLGKARNRARKGANERERERKRGSPW